MVNFEARRIIMLIHILTNITLVISIIYLFYRFFYKFKRSILRHAYTRVALLTLLAVTLTIFTVDIDGYIISMYFVPLLLISLVRHPFLFTLSYGLVILVQWLTNIFHLETIIIFLVAYAVSTWVNYSLNMSKFINMTVSHSLFIFMYFGIIYLVFPGLPLMMIVAAILVAHLIMFVTTVILNDITIIARILNRYEQDEYTDHLTQLGNIKALDRDVERWMNSKNHITMYLIDIDGFGTYNEHYGYRAGDAIIRQMVDALKNTSPQGSLLFRNGGEEFTMLIPELSLDKSVRLADGIRKSIEKHRFYINDEEQISLTITIGIGYHSKSLDTNKNTLFKDAGDMLHAAKKQGQNQIMFSPL